MGTKRGTEKHEVKAIVTSVFSVVSGHDVPKLWRLYLKGESLQDDTAFKDDDRCLRDRNTQNRAPLQEVKHAKCQVPLLASKGKRGYQITRKMNSHLSLLNLDQPLLLHTCCCWPLFRSLYLGLKCAYCRAEISHHFPENK